MSRCPKHEYAVTKREKYIRQVTCLRCGGRPKCYRTYPLVLRDGQTITIGNHLHSQGETIEEAMGKARLCYALSNGQDQVEPVRCRHCGFWTIRDVKGERIPTAHGGDDARAFIEHVRERHGRTNHVSD